MCDQLKDLDELITQVHAGPLGLIFAAPGGAALPAAAAGEPRKVRPASSEAETLDPAAAVAGDIPPQALLWVDGAGSYLLLRGPVSSIGRLASRRPADIPLICDLSEHHADVRRVDGDYFLDVHGETGNAGGPRPVLLHDGDKIILGRRARFVFQLPSRKCSSAVLDLVGSARMPNDVRRVILFDRLLTVGPAPQSHIVVPAASAPVVLFERGGRLWLRLQAESAPDQAVEMVAGRRVELAGLSLVLQPWSRK
jgi:hypothetical protein